MALVGPLVNMNPEDESYDVSMSPMSPMISFFFEQGLGAGVTAMGLAGY